MARFETPQDKPVINRREANRVQETAANARQRGTPNDMIIASRAEELLGRCTIIDDN